MIKVAFATGMYREFGNKGSLPWQGHPNQKHDFTAFKEFTKDCIIVMGRHTFASLPFRLPNRMNVVISKENNVRASNGDSADTYVRNLNVGVRSYLENLDKYFEQDVVVIGGAGLVRETLDFADEVMYTQFHNRKGYKHDVVMPLLPEYIRSADVYEYKTFGENETFMDISYYRREDD